MKRCFAVLLIGFWGLLASTALVAYPGDGPLIEATMVLCKKQTGEKADREVRVTAINSEGYIEGSDASGKQYFLFKDLEKITFDLSKHAYTVTTWDGKTATLKFGKLTTHKTSPTFDIMIWDENEKKSVESMMDATQIKSLVFKKGSASAAPADKGTPAPAADQAAPAAADAAPGASANAGNPDSGKEMSKQQIIEAWKEMAAVLDRNEELFNQFNGGRFTSKEEYESYLGKLETFLKEDLTKIQNILAGAQKHGKTPNDINNTWRKIVGNDDPFQGSRSVDALIMNLESGQRYVNLSH
jgi:hypothetical protein